MVYKLQAVIDNAKKKLTAAFIGVTSLMFPAAMILSTGAAAAATQPFQLVPFEFVGTVANCGTAGTDTVTANWDNSVGNPAPSIMLQKLGATSNCAAAGVDIITPLEGHPAAALTELNYDYRTGEHCGAGAPRFNIQTETGTAVTLGCTSGTQTPNATTGWTHVEFNQAQIAAAVATAGAGTTLQDLYIIFDEGSDTPAGGTVGTPGTVHIDNISVNNAIVGSPTTPQSRNDCLNNGFQTFTDNNGHPFNSQAQCVAFVNRGTNRVVHKNINNVRITNQNRQNARTGNARVTNNTNGGNASSGAASNSNSSSTTVTITNTD